MGNNEVSIAINEKHKDKIIKFLKGERILQKEFNLVALTIIFSKDFIHTPGIIFQVVRKLAWENINIFEIISENQKSSVGGGGRYNKTVGKYLNKEIPAVGISFGLSRLTSLAKLEIKNTKTIIISIKQDTLTNKLTKKLRKKEISCIAFFGKPGKALEFANSQKIQYAIFIGEEEIKLKKYKLKNMISGEEKLLTEKQLISKLKKQ